MIAKLCQSCAEKLRGPEPERDGPYRLTLKDWEPERYCTLCGQPYWCQYYEATSKAEEQRRADAARRKSQTQERQSARRRAAQSREPFRDWD